MNCITASSKAHIRQKSSDGSILSTQSCAGIDRLILSDVRAAIGKHLNLRCPSLACRAASGRPPGGHHQTLCLTNLSANHTSSF
jgi:hypothetical protein